MAHSLFEPATEPFHEKLIRRVRDLRGKSPTPDVGALTQFTASGTFRTHQAARLDARRRQFLLQQIFETDQNQKPRT